MNPPPSRLWQRGIQTTPGFRPGYTKPQLRCFIRKAVGGVYRASNVNRGYTARNPLNHNTAGERDFFSGSSRGVSPGVRVGAA